MAPTGATATETNAVETDEGTADATGSTGGDHSGSGDPPLPTGGQTPCAEGDACPPGSACDSPGACASGFCVDGVCCDSACEDTCQTCAPAGVCGPVSPEAQPECGSGTAQWALSLGAPVDVEAMPNDNFDRGTALAIDEAGNLYLVGTFNQQIDFGGGVAVSNGGDDGFVVSFDPAGQYRWHHVLGTSGHDTGGGVTSLPGTNEVVVVGATSGDPGIPGTWTGTGLRGFVAKFEATSGDLTAGRAIDATEQSRSMAVAADASGIYVTGGFQGALTLDGMRASMGDEDVFAARLDAALQPTWTWTGGDVNKDLGRGIAVSSTGSVALTGFMSGPGKAGAATQDLMVTGFTAPLGAAPSWRNLYASPMDTQAKGHALAWTPDGDVITTGFYEGPVTFGQSTLDGGGADGVLMRLAGPSGTTVWALTYGSVDNDNSRGVAVDAAGNIFVAGEFNQNLSIGPTITSNGDDDVFMLKFDGQGTHLWSRGFGGPSNDNGNTVALGPDGSVYAAGHFRDTAMFGETPLTAAEGADIFLMRMVP
ncbi:MAG: hypothetical protein AAGA54_28275 [Myxococcota bacterium]